jgi:hypothetical protein
LSRASTVDLTARWGDIARHIDRVPVMPALTLALFEVSQRVTGRLPWIATLEGFVVLGADCIGVHTDPDGDRRFILEPPGAWFSAWDRHRLQGSRGGRPWVIRRPRAC